MCHMQAWAKQRQIKADRRLDLQQEETAYVARLAACAAITAKLQQAQAADARHKRQLLRCVIKQILQNVLVAQA